MNLIQIGYQYSIIVEDYEKISIGDIIKSESQLRKDICYPKITKDSTTTKRLQPIIKLFIGYERIGGNKIRITSIEPPQRVREIVETHLKTARATESRIVYSNNRKYLLDYIVCTFDTNPLYLTTYDIISNSTMFQDFFYEYNDIHYDKYHSTADEVNKINEFVIKYAISDKQYLIDIMDILSDILYKIFKYDNISSWAGSREVKVERVLFQKGNELDKTATKEIEEKYIQPLIKKGVPAKSRIKLANRQYMTDNDIPPSEHDWFYYVNRFIPPDKFTLNVNDKDFLYNQIELSRKVIEKLISKAVDNFGGDYHRKNARNFDEILNKIIVNVKNSPIR